MNLRMIGKLLPVVLMLFSAAASADDPAMKPFTSSVGRFTIQFPGTPTQSSQSVALKKGGSATLYMFRVNLQDDYVSYLVTYTDYPASFTMGAAQTELAEARDGAAAGKTLTSDVEISLGGVPGRAMTLVDGNGTSQSVHQFLAGKRLYQVIAVAEKGYNAALTEQFMNSFRIN